MGNFNQNQQKTGKEGQSGSQQKSSSSSSQQQNVKNPFQQSNKNDRNS